MTIDKEMREAYHQWFSSQPLPTIGIVTPQGEVGYSEEAVKWGFQAAYQLQQKRIEELEKHSSRIRNMARFVSEDCSVIQDQEIFVSHMEMIHDEAQTALNQIKGK